MSIINKININGIDYDIEDKNKATKTSQLENDSNFISQLKTVNGQSLEGEGDIEIEGGSGDTLPINAIFEYDGDVVPEGYEEVEEEPVIVEETDPTVPDYVKAITQEDIEKWNTDVDLTGFAKKSEIPTNVSQLTNDKNYINQIKTINGQSLEGEGDIEIESGSGGILEETDPTVPAHVKSITEEDIAKWNSGTGSGTGESVKNSLELYSFEETLIGVWQNKPLYRKVLDFGYLANKDQKRVPHNIDNVDKFITIKGVTKNDSTGVNFELPFVNSIIDAVISIFITSDNQVSVECIGSDRTNYYCYVILEYTKTTDKEGTIVVPDNVAVDLTEYIHKDELKTINGNSLIGEGDITIEGGSYSGREYSTEERVVGTWKDGKTLYGRLIEVPAPETTTDGTFAYVDVPIENCDYCFIEWTTITDKEGNQVTFPYFTNAGYSIKSYFSGYSRGVRIVNGVKNYNSCPVTASVLYTKTTD